MANIKQSEKNEIVARIFDTFSFIFLFPFPLFEKCPQKKKETMVINPKTIKTAIDISNTLFIAMQSF